MPIRHLSMPETYHALGLSDEEYQRLLDVLGREPTPTELAMFSVEWSEHCGYMCSRPSLNLLPKRGKYPTTVGEDSGAVIVGDYAIVFKMESHNHPSQIEPLQGAATGVGGILRDIFTAGARPIASLNSLRFGNLKDSYNKHLVREVVRGIGWYGNCVGVPTVGGEIYFDDSYNGNCLVNAMTIGICDKNKLARARASGVGNSIMYVGNTTGRDGIGGCSVLASHEFADEEAKRPTVQVGDPFTEKCLIEATLEILDTGYVTGIKDMGAAGLTCSISEMAAAGGVGIDASLDEVPLRETGMEAWEIMMSESQERMLVCVEVGRESVIKAIFDKWELKAAVIGTVTENTSVRITYQGEVVADVDAQKLTDPPTYELPTNDPHADAFDVQINWNVFEDDRNQSKNLIKMLSDPTIASKRWVYEQYDHMVQTNTVTLPGRGDAAVIRIKGTNMAIAATVDCNSTRCRLNPYQGGVQSVIEAATNLICSGAEPIAVTDCLNFGSPKNPEVFWQFQEAVRGIATICRALDVPVVSGNVSFYNESPEGPINPTPTIGMVGVIKNVENVMTQNFKREGDVVLVIQPPITLSGGHAEYLRVLHGVEDASVPHIGMMAQKSLHGIMLEVIQAGLLQSAHDCSEGGLTVAIAESCISGNTLIGATLELPRECERRDAELFHEGTQRIVVSCRPNAVERVISACHNRGWTANALGHVGGRCLTITRKDETIIDVTVNRMHQAWSNSLEKRL